MSDIDQECEVPFIEQLRSVPSDYRDCKAIQWDEEGREIGHRFIPYGFMMHRAAAELERLKRELVQCQKDTQRLDWAESHPEDAMKEIQSRWAMCGDGFREECFNFRGAIDAKRKDHDDGQCISGSRTP